MKFRRTKQPSGRQRIISEAGRPQAFSYHANRNDQDFNLGRLQPRAAADERKRGLLIRYWRQRIVAVVAGLVILFCILDILHLSPTPKVVALTNSTTGYFLQSTEVYQQAASKLFRASIWNGNKITINSGQIAADLRTEFPELSDVSIALPLMGHRAVVYIAPTTPSLLYTTAAATGGTFVLDQSGTAIIQANQLGDLGKLNLPAVTDQSSLSVRRGQQAMPADSVRFIQAVAEELGAKGVAIHSMTLPAQAYELDVYPSGVGYYVKFNMHNTGSALQQVGTFLAVRQRLSTEHITPSQYIDVRIDGRAYYK